jgi:RNA polymerase sigma factor (sigma-70 family)
LTTFVLVTTPISVALFRVWVHHDAVHMGYRLSEEGRERRTLRRLKRRLEVELAAEKSPSQYVNEAELARQVRQAVSWLPDMDREILLMRTFEDLSHQEIACILEIEVTTARKRYGRALVRLNKLLTDSGLSESQL